MKSHTVKVKILSLISPGAVLPLIYPTVSWTAPWDFMYSHLHPSSSLKGREPEWVCYGTIRMTSREYMMNVMCT